ncbi:MAG TPA: hypothetical protein GXZ48_03970 [Acholeplasmataceae bacterium]|jgi:competence protein ComEA|nr:hypothetical protein [Acholeplasmataceae bacterium]
MMKKNIVIGIAIFVLIICGIIINMINQKEPVIIDAGNDDISDSPGVIYVHISGEVVRPGVYEMDIDDRVNDLIILAGGFTSHADTDSINLVQKLVDGMKIIVRPKETKITNKISINKATIDDLKKLDGIGDAKARAIIEHRNNYGLFSSIEDLVIYKIISEKDFEKIKDDICT